MVQGVGDLVRAVNTGYVAPVVRAGIDAGVSALEAGLSNTPPIVWDYAREHAQDIEMFRTGAGLAGAATALVNAIIPESSGQDSTSRKRLRSGSYKHSRPPALKLDSTQLYRSQPGTDPKKRTFAHPPWWTRATSGTPPSHTSFHNNSNWDRTRSQGSTPSPWSRRNYLNSPSWLTPSPNSALRHVRHLKWFKTRLLLRARSRRRNRAKTYLGTALRQTSRRVLHLRKKYIVAHRSSKRRIRRALAKALRARYIARRRFRNA